GQLDVNALGVIAHEMEIVLHQRIAQRLGLVFLVLDPDGFDVRLGLGLQYRLFDGGGYGLGHMSSRVHGIKWASLQTEQFQPRIMRIARMETDLSASSAKSAVGCVRICRMTDDLNCQLPLSV